ncbi:MAG: YeeE/YedE family protein [Colwellia sp.]|nr:YeeE/YedE family protein [Colwellia sp.]
MKVLKLILVETGLYKRINSNNGPYSKDKKIAGTTLMLLLIVLILVCILGFLAQSTGLCMVKGVNEWKAGNKEFLLAIIFSGILAWVATLFAHYADIPLKFRTYQISGWFLFGGFIFGIGTAFNQGCGVSTLGKLARGDSKMIATIVGWLVGWTILAHWQPAIDVMKNPLPSNITYLLLMVSSLALIIWAFLGNKQRKTLWFSMMGIGLLAGFIFLYEPKWPPSGLLNQLSSALIDNKTKNWPSLEQYFLFIALLLGMFLAAWRTNKFMFVASNIKHWAGHLVAGTFMGIGASIAIGGNDSQLLLALPAFSPGGIVAVIGMLAGIWVGLFVRDKILVRT